MTYIRLFFRKIAYGKLTLCFVFLVLACAAGRAEAFTYFEVVKRARALAAERYTPPGSAAPEALRALNFGEYQQIQQKRSTYHWSADNSPFTVKYNHQGMQFSSAVKIHIVDAQGVREAAFSPELFDYGDLGLDPAAFKGLGFAGFRILSALNSPDKPDDEVASFLGATYFRMIGRGQVYGASARGLAIDTALPSGEQFPRFTEFWIARPSRSDQHIQIYALLDSPSVTGAYRFTLTPGEDTVVDVRAQLYFRTTVGKLGVAPLTSMFLFGANQPSSTPNFRPELHDSDGLSIHTGRGEWLWRPLNNPRRLSISAFQVEQLRGFGLMQRARSFLRYEDLEDRYELRPSVWVQPKGDWGAGRVELVEIPTGDETNDNIVAFWVPKEPPQAGQPLLLDYRLIWTRNDLGFHDPNLGWVAQTRRSPGEVRGDDLVRRPDGTVMLRVDFRGQVLEDLDPGVPVVADVSSNANVEIIESTVVRNPVSRGYRLLLRLKVKEAAKVSELRAFLKAGEMTLSEVWSYQLPSND